MASIRELREALPGFTYIDYLRHARLAGELAGAATPCRVAVLRSYTAEPLEPVLRVRLLLDGFAPSCWFGGYNQYVQEILDTDSALYRFEPDFVLLLVRLEELEPEFVEHFSIRPASEWRDRLAAKARELATLAGRVTQHTRSQVIVQNAVLPAAYFGLFDAQQRESQASIVEEFNRTLAEAAESAPGVFVWNFAEFVARKGWDALYDAKAWYVSRNPFKQSMYPALVDDLYRYLRSGAGRVKKVVVVDLDNTLWGGIAGEDGFEGIRLGDTYPGNCYKDLQRELRKLHDRGILLAINSKNNEADAWRIVDEHPDMVLRREHFAAARINWQDKATNLRELARELNVGLDSFVFIDDNAAECEFVRRTCPECDVIQLPDKPYLLPATIAALPCVDTIRLTPEDRQKTRMYRTRAVEREAAATFSNVEEFLESLDMEVAIRPATAFSIPRIAQLTQKTNQMNMTTRRYSETEIAAFASDAQRAVFSIAARDRLGDHGIIGVLVLEFAGSTCRIDTLLLSCRVIGRGIERLMLSVAAETARQRECRTLVGEFFPTPKNVPAAGLYAEMGFQPVAPTEYHADLQTIDLPPPIHIRVVSDSTALTEAAHLHTP